jgi:iron complex transport system substrate-binding protein
MERRSTMRKTFLRRTAMIVAAGALLAGCGNANSDTSGHTSGKNAAKPATGASFPRTITHDKGATEIPARPQRIVALDNSLVDAVVLLKGPLVGGISSYRDLKGFPPYLGAAVKNTTEVGPLESPDLEAIAALKPDLIVSATIRHDAIYDELSKIAPTVFVKTTGPQWQQNITLLGRTIGAEAQAAKSLAAYKERAKIVGDEINAKAGKPTISVVRFLDGPTRLMQKATFIGSILKDAGLARPKSQDVEDFALEVGEEQIRQADGDHIFVTSFSGGNAAKERFERNPLWKQLDGVKAGNVHDVPDEIWMTSVSVQGAQIVLDNLAKTFGVNPARA